MAFNVDGLIQAIIDAQNPQNKENRRIVKGFLSDSMAERALNAVDNYVALCEKLDKAVQSGIITQERADMAIAAQERILDATSKYVAEFLK